jgi:gamma-glutamylcyclotransferase (GGCT)/AIG2-like uncharacterized protein YtfP
MTNTDHEEAGQRLAVYGTLASGQPNHHLLADLGAQWIEGRVRGDSSRLGGALHG